MGTLFDVSWLRGIGRVWLGVEPATTSNILTLPHSHIKEKSVVKADYWAKQYLFSVLEKTLNAQHEKCDSSAKRDLLLS